MIIVPSSPNRRKNLDRNGGSDKPCIVCGKAVKDSKHYIHLWNGSHAVLRAEIPALNPAGDTGHYPVGAECLRQYPELRPYVKDAGVE